MSGVNYSSASVTKTDLKLVEDYARSLSLGGGSLDEYVRANRNTTLSIPLNSDTLLDFP